MSILIKNGTIYDGDKTPAFKADILIKNNSIAKIGGFEKNEADEVIDATDCLVTPGFIDINSASDHYLDIITDPYQEKFIKSGVTTIIGGNCGSSLAPLSRGDLKSIRKWGVDKINETNIGWHSFKEFIDVIEKRGVGVNFGTLLGHHTVRSEIIKDNSKDLTKKELSDLLYLIEKDLEEGALGVSIGLEYTHSRNLQEKELVEIAKLVNSKKRVFVSHLRDSQKVKKSIKELFEITKDNNNIEINHLQPLSSSLKEYKEIEGIIEQKSDKQNINFDCNPYPGTILPFYKFLPDSLQFGDLEEMTEGIENNKDKVIEYLKQLTSKKIIIANVPKSLNFYNGKTLKEIASNCGTTQIETLYKLMIQTNLRGVCIYHNVNERTLDEFTFSKESFIASNGSIILLPNFNPFIKFLKKVEKSKSISLEKAIAKITSLPAKKYGIKNRGVIKKDYKADLVIMKDFKIRDVFVNGEKSLENERINKTLSGDFVKWEN